MKNLNITRKTFESSRYLQKKYGKLEYVSESGKMFKTDKGNVLKFIKESSDFDAEQALAKKLGVSEDNITDMSGEYEHFKPDYTFGVRLKDGRDAIYVVYDNDESAFTAASDDLGEVFRDDPPILGAAIEYFGFSTFSSYINGLDEEELGDIQELQDEMGKEEFARFIQNNIGVDYYGFAKYNIEELGTAWHLASYDGRELELSNGMVAYRVD